MTHPKQLPEPPDGEGERALRARRARIAALSGALLALGAVAGFAAGYVNGGAYVLAPAVALSCVIAFFIVAGVLTWVYFRNTDEVDIRDNMVATFVGFFAYVLGFPAWTFLAQNRAAPDVDPEGLFLLVAMITILVYAGRKVLNR
jgi:drug/metabolite transporter (DMT)-like permease